MSTTKEINESMNVTSGLVHKIQRAKSFADELLIKHKAFLWITNPKDRERLAMLLTDVIVLRAMHDLYEVNYLYAATMEFPVDSANHISTKDAIFPYRGDLCRILQDVYGEFAEFCTNTVTCNIMGNTFFIHFNINVPWSGVEPKKDYCYRHAIFKMEGYGQPKEP